MADHLYVPDDDSDYGPVWESNEAREHFSADDLADARPAELVVSLDGARGHYLAVDWMVEVSHLLGEVPTDDPWTHVDRTQRLGELANECLVAYARYHAHNDVIGADPDDQATYGSDCPLGDDGFPDCECQWVGEVADDVARLLGDAGYVTEWGDGVRTWRVAPEADAQPEGTDNESASPLEPSPREGVASICQHCGGAVAFGPTEHGYRGFTHVATGATECPDDSSASPADGSSREGVATDDPRIVDVVEAGGHSVITYRWRGGLVSSTGPAGRTDERIAEILERGDD